MSEINDGGPAFPVVASTGDPRDGVYCRDGLSMRDYFAGQALAGLSSAVTRSDAVRWAWEMADAMLAARSKPKV